MPERLFSSSCSPVTLPRPSVVTPCHWSSGRSESQPSLFVQLSPLVAAKKATRAARCASGPEGSVAFGVPVGTSDGVGVGVDVAVAVGVGIGVAVLDGVSGAVAVGLAVAVAVGVRVAVGVLVGLAVAVAAGIGTGVLDGSAVAVAVGFGVAAGAGCGVGVAVGVGALVVHAATTASVAISAALMEARVVRMLPLRVADGVYRITISCTLAAGFCLGRGS